MIDLHAHVLPGVDDGAPTEPDALEMLTSARQDGIATIAATSHVRAKEPSASPRELASRAAQLNEAAARAGVGVQVVSGAEVDLAWAEQASDEELRACTYGARGTDLLVETPYPPLDDTFEDRLFGLSVRGFRILLAHPERNLSFHHAPERLADLVARGTLVQVTALALLNPDHRSRSRRLAERMVADGLAHVIASDAHRATGKRPVGIAAGVAAAGLLSSPEHAAWMVTAAPAAILAGEPLPPAPVAQPRSRFGLPWR